MMKFRNILSLFLFLTMMFTLGQSIAVSSAAHEYSSSQVNSYSEITSAQPSLSLTQRTAFSWSAALNVTKRILSVVGACALIVVTLLVDAAWHTITLLSR